MGIQVSSIFRLGLVPLGYQAEFLDFGSRRAAPTLPGTSTRRMVASYKNRASLTGVPHVPTRLRLCTPLQSPPCGTARFRFAR